MTATAKGRAIARGTAHRLAATRWRRLMRRIDGSMIEAVHGYRYALSMPHAALPPDRESEPSPLEEYFDAVQEGAGIHKWRHYFGIYDRHLARFVGRDVHMVEIGVSSGGSLEMWRTYLGAQAHIHGIDIEEACRVYEADRITISIGDQANPDFWQRFLADHPRIDIVLDDGGHTPEQQITTLRWLLPHISPGGVYLCEDIHGPLQPFHSFVDGLARALHQVPESRETNPRAIHEHVAAIHTYPILTVIEKPAHKVPAFYAPRHGSQWQPFSVPAEGELDARD